MQGTFHGRGNTPWSAKLAESAVASWTLRRPEASGAGATRLLRLYDRHPCSTLPMKRLTVFQQILHVKLYGLQSHPEMQEMANS